MYCDNKRETEKSSKFSLISTGKFAFCLFFFLTFNWLLISCFLPLHINLQQRQSMMHFPLNYWNCQCFLQHSTDQIKNKAPGDSTGTKTRQTKTELEVLFIVFDPFFFFDLAEVAKGWLIVAEGKKEKQNPFYIKEKKMKQRIFNPAQL